MISLVIIAHQPMATALKDVALHMFPDTRDLYAYDVVVDSDPHADVQSIVDELMALPSQQLLLLSDLCGATPSNIAARVAQHLNEQGKQAQLISGANACMVVSAISNRNQQTLTLEKVVDGALRGIKVLVDGKNNVKSGY